MRKIPKILKSKSITSLHHHKKGIEKGLIDVLKGNVCIAKDVDDLMRQLER